MFGFFKRSIPAPPATASALRSDQLLPRIAPLSFLKAMHAASLPAAQRPIYTPLCGELLVHYVFDMPDNPVPASAKSLAEAGIAPADLQQLALVNLKRRLPKPTFFSKDNCRLVQTGQSLESALLLVDSLWKQMDAKFAGDILASAPCRDRLLLCDSADPDAIAALRALSAEFFQKQSESGRLSTQLLQRRGGKWSLFARQ